MRRRVALKTKWLQGSVWGTEQPGLTARDNKVNSRNECSSSNNQLVMCKIAEGGAMTAHPASVYLILRLLSPCSLSSGSGRRAKMATIKARTKHAILKTNGSCGAPHLLPRTYSLPWTRGPTTLRMATKLPL